MSKSLEQMPKSLEQIDNEKSQADIIESLKDLKEGQGIEVTHRGDIISRESRATALTNDSAPIKTSRVTFERYVGDMSGDFLRTGSGNIFVEHIVDFELIDNEE